MAIDANALHNRRSLLGHRPRCPCGRRGCSARITARRAGRTTRMMSWSGSPTAPRPPRVSPTPPSATQPSGGTRRRPAVRASGSGARRRRRRERACWGLAPGTGVVGSEWSQQLGVPIGACGRWRLRTVCRRRWSGWEYPPAARRRSASSRRLARRTLRRASAGTSSWTSGVACGSARVARPGTNCPDSIGATAAYLISRPSPRPASDSATRRPGVLDGRCDRSVYTHELTVPVTRDEPQGRQHGIHEPR